MSVTAHLITLETTIKRGKTGATQLLLETQLTVAVVAVVTVVTVTRVVRAAEAEALLLVLVVLEERLELQLLGLQGL